MHKPSTRIRTLVTLAAILVMVAATIQAAVATVQATKCLTNQFAGNSIEVCFSVNEHKTWHWHEGYAGFHSSNLDVWVDFVRIYRNGNLVDANTYPQWTLAGNVFTTDWATNCNAGDDWYSKTRYRFRAPSGAISNYFSNVSNTLFNDCD